MYILDKEDKEHKEKKKGMSWSDKTALMMHLRMILCAVIVLSMTLLPAISFVKEQATNFRNNTETKKQKAEEEEEYQQAKEAQQAQLASGQTGPQKKVIACGVNDIVDEYGNTALHYAVRDGRESDTLELIERGANLHLRNDWDYTPLEYAKITERPKIEAILLEAIEKEDEFVGNNALIVAARDGNTREIRSLIQSKQIDINAANAYNETALSTAVNHGFRDVIALLIQAGSDVNVVLENSFTPIFIAAGSGDANIVAMLIKARADVNVVDNYGQTPLMRAAYMGYQDIAAQLIAAKNFLYFLVLDKRI